MIGEQQQINYHGPGQAILYDHHLTQVRAFKVLDSSIYAYGANLTVTDDVYIDYSVFSSFVFAGADGVLFVGQIQEAGAGVCVIGSLFLRFLRWVRSIIACWRDNANDDQVLP